MPIRVLQVIESLGQGGAERALAEITPHLAEREIETSVVCLHRRDGFAELFERSGVSVAYLEAHSRLGRVRELTRWLRDHPVDLVHTTLFEADVSGRPAAAACRVPVVSTLPTVPYGVQKLRTRQVRAGRLVMAQMVDAVTCRLVRRFHAVSATVADAASRQLLIRRGRIDVVYRGRDQDLLGVRTDDRTRRVRRGLGFGPEAEVILAMSRHEYEKGLDVLLAAFPAVLTARPRARLVVAGRDGLQTAALRAEVEALGLGEAVELLGFRRDVHDLLSAADVFVLPSRREGLPGSAIEALALSVPVVASDIPAIREVLPAEEFGLLVPPGDPRRLSDALVAALADRAAATRRADAGRQRFLDRFTIDRAADGMAAFYRRALRSS